MKKNVVKKLQGGQKPWNSHLTEEALLLGITILVVDMTALLEMRTFGYPLFLMLPILYKTRRQGLFYQRKSFVPPLMRAAWGLGCDFAGCTSESGQGFFRCSKSITIGFYGEYFESGHSNYYDIIKAIGFFYKGNKILYGFCKKKSRGFKQKELTELEKVSRRINNENE